MSFVYSICVYKHIIVIHAFVLLRAIALFVLNGMKQSGFASVGRSVGFFFLMNSQKVCTAGRGCGNVILYSRGCRMHAAAPPPPTTTSIKLGDRAAAVAASADLFSNQ